MHPFLLKDKRFLFISQKFVFENQYLIPVTVFLQSASRQLKYSLRGKWDTQLLKKISVHSTTLFRHSGRAVWSSSPKPPPVIPNSCQCTRQYTSLNAALDCALNVVFLH